MLRRLLTVLFLVLLTMPFAAKASAEFPYHPVAYVVLDRTGNATNQDFLSWREQVRQAYYVPYYEIIKDNKPTAVTVEYLREHQADTSKLTEDDLRALTAKLDTEVTVLVFINTMQERVVHGRGIFRREWGEVFQEVTVSADFYIYKKSEDKMLKKKLRSFESDDLALSVPASQVVRDELRKLVNKMEGRAQI